MMHSDAVLIGANPRAFTFSGGECGEHSVTSQNTLSGDPLQQVESLEITSGIGINIPPKSAWSLSGVVSNDRYTTRPEKAELIKLQKPIGRPEAQCSALILLRKNADWWAMTQDERRLILEEKSHHIAIGVRYLPAISRRLLHCRDLLEAAPFDFIGYLDYRPTDAILFDDMLGQLRATEEWTFIDREVDIRMTQINKDG